MTTSGVAVTRPWATALIVAARPRQWVKNLLVFAAPMAGGVLTDGEVFGRALTAGVAFVLASAGCYLLNDVYDAGRDRLHPDKQHRPIASGQVSAAAATLAAIALLSLSVAVSVTLDREMLTVVLLTYVGLTLGYSGGVKDVPVLELLVLSGGFVLRALAGAAATGVRPSNWFLSVCCLAALTIAMGKRQVELTRLGGSASGHRATLAAYSVPVLRRMRILAAVGTLACYASWAATRTGTQDLVLALASLLPVAAAFVRLGRLNDAGDGDAPELVLYRDRWILACCLAWLVLFALGPAHV